MTIRFIACQSFAGGFDCGATQGGLTMIHKVEQKGGFGLANVDRNRHIVGDGWGSQACHPTEWHAMSAEVVLGNPPCSGFSPLSVKTFRGMNSSINECMWRLVDYAALCDPQVVVFESVQQAYSGGIELMRALRTRLEERSGKRWDLFHVKHNAASVGGSCIRRRYFWVASRVPFGVEQVDLRGVPTLADVISDLADLDHTWLPQPYREPPRWWPVEQGARRTEMTYVDGHIGRRSPYISRGLDLIAAGETWGPRENIEMVARRYYERVGDLPPSWVNTRDKLVATDFKMGYNQLVRWRGDGMARVITGGGLDLVLHPYRDRTLTHREVARIMGFPDDWLIEPLRGVSGLHMTWGKGITVQCGRWIAEWVRNSIEGSPGSDHGELIGEREFLIDHTNLYRKFTNES